ncbi:MAG TPA: hypothetical protein VM367_08595 [Pseudonocardia sp.]|jgi:hypothetical protein|nr:hypothetical protein [Pseudonocardia sp.]
MLEGESVTLTGEPGVDRHGRELRYVAFSWGGAGAPPPESHDEDVEFDGPTPGDQGLPDGTLTGGYCARKWWC